MTIKIKYDNSSDMVELESNGKVVYVGNYGDLELSEPEGLEQLLIDLNIDCEMEAFEYED